jgi:hypothetical protein
MRILAFVAILILQGCGVGVEVGGSVGIQQEACVSTIVDTNITVYCTHLGVCIPTI